jgi:hypothetical protein
VLRPIERTIFPQHGPHHLVIRVDTLDQAGDALPRVREICTEHHIQVDRFALRAAKQHGELIELRCRVQRPEELGQATRELRALPGVNAVRADVGGAQAHRQPWKRAKEAP